MNKQTRRKENLLNLLISSATLMVQGSLVTLNSRCGKVSCICERDRRHYHRRYYLSWTEGGRTHMMYIPSKQLKAFRQGIRAWSRFKEVSKKLARLNAQMLKLRQEDTI